MIQFKENAQTDRRTDRWKDGQKDEQTLFYRTLLTTIGGPTTKKSFIQVTNGNSLQISSLWMLLLPHQPNQTHPCWGWARQQSKQKLGPFFGCCVSYKLAKMLFFSSKIHKNQEKHVPFYLQYAFFCFLWKLPLFSTPVSMWATLSGELQFLNESVSFILL